MSVVLLGILTPIYAQYKSERSFDTFEKIVLSDGIRAKIIQSNEHKVKLSVSDMPETKVLSSLSAYELTLKLETGLYEKGQVYAEIYVKNLKRIEIKDKASASSDDPIKGDDLKINASTSAKTDLILDYQYLEVESTTQADVKTSGFAKIARLNAGTQGRIQAYELDTESIITKVTTQGEAFLKSENEIEATATTGGKIYYKGEPSRIREKTSLGGEIIK